MGTLRRQRLEDAIAFTTVIPLADTLPTRAPELRFASRRAGHSLADRAHANDLWIAVSAIRIGAPLLTADRVIADTPGLALLTEPVDLNAIDGSVAHPAGKGTVSGGSVSGGAF